MCMNFSKSAHEERLIVFNPLTEESKEIPPLLHRRNPVLMHMYVDQSSKSYYILAAGSSASGDESSSRITELYNSRTGQWQRVGDLPGPAFALNDYQSGLVENNGDLFLFSERDNDPVIEHWVDRIEWTESEGDSEEKTDATFTLVNVLKKEKSGGRSLEVYPEFALVPFSKSQLCIYNTVDHSGEVFDIEDREKCEALPPLPEGFGGESASSLENLPSNPGRSFWCFILGIVGITTHLNVVGASPTSAPGLLSSQASSAFPAEWHWGIRATIVAAVAGVLGLCVAIYMCFYRRERGDSLRGVLREFFRPFEQGARGLRMYARGVKLREGSVDVVRFRSSRGSSRESSPESSPV